MPERKSRYRLPARSYRWQPLPRASTSGYRASFCSRYSHSWSITACAAASKTGGGAVVIYSSYSGTDRPVPRRAFCAAWTGGSVPGVCSGRTADRPGGLSYLQQLFHQTDQVLLIEGYGAVGAGVGEK